MRNDVDEKCAQEFIKKSPLMLARFSAIPLYIRPPLLEKYFADFVIYSVRGELLFI